MHARSHKGQRKIESGSRAAIYKRGYDGRIKTSHFFWFKPIEDVLARSRAFFASTFTVSNRFRSRAIWLRKSSSVKVLLAACEFRHAKR